MMLLLIAEASRFRRQCGCQQPLWCSCSPAVQRQHGCACTPYRNCNCSLSSLSCRLPCQQQCTASCQRLSPAFLCGIICRHTCSVACSKSQSYDLPTPASATTKTPQSAPTNSFVIHLCFVNCKNVCNSICPSQYSSHSGNDQCSVPCRESCERTCVTPQDSIEVHVNFKENPPLNPTCSGSCRSSCSPLASPEKCHAACDAVCRRVSPEQKNSEPMTFQQNYLKPSPRTTTTLTETLPDLYTTIPPLYQNPLTTPVPPSAQSPSPQCLNQCGTGCQQSCLQRNPQPQEGCNRSCANTCNYVCASSPLSQMTAMDVSIYPVRLDPRERCSSECQSVCQIVCRTQLTARKCFDSCAPQCERVCEEPQVQEHSARLFSQNPLQNTTDLHSVDFSQQSTVAKQQPSTTAAPPKVNPSWNWFHQAASTSE